MDRVGGARLAQAGTGHPKPAGAIPGTLAIRGSSRKVRMGNTLVDYKTDAGVATITLNDPPMNATRTR